MYRWIDERCADGVDHTAQIVQQIMIPKAQDSKPLCFQPRCSKRILFLIVLSAVEFDDQLSLKTGEVGNERLDRMLEAKFVSIKPAITHRLPEMVLSLRSFTAKSGGVWANLSPNRIHWRKVQN